MRWQKIARLIIAMFVIVFTGFVIAALRRPSAAPGPEAAPRTTPDAIAETHGGTHRVTDDATGKIRHQVDFESQVTYADGRSVLKNAVVTLPDRGGRTVVIRTGEMEAIGPADEGAVTLIKAAGGVKLQASDGLEVTAGEATYDDRNGFLHVPGPVQFTRGRMSGSGIGATYNRDQDVLWILDQARITVKPDADGSGAAAASAKAAGLAQGEHYIRLTENATLASDGQTLAAQDITIQLAADNEAIRSIALRGDSRITGAGPGSVAEGMSARDIDLAYAEDGRTLQEARLMEGAEIAFGGAPGARRISGRTIDLRLGPDGTTVTSLNASGAVQLDLPAEAGAPPRRIVAPVLKAGGPAGLQTATFSGGTTYRELLPAASSGASRTARSQTLIVQTEPGLGALTEADFRGNVRIEDEGTTAEGKRALYRVAQDRFELLPSPSDPGPPASVNDARMRVTARTIAFSPGAETLKAEGDVRSAIQGGTRSGGAGSAAKGAPRDGARLPALLKEGEPVNVTSARLDYDGAAGIGTYEGDARLFQDGTSIRGDTIVIDDEKANLTARGHVRSVMVLEERDARTGATSQVQTIATGDTLVYEDASRLATYTTGPTAKAHLVGTQGDVTAERIRLFLHAESNGLERAEAENGVTLKEGPRIATGDHLIYTPATETYVMRGRPVIIEERIPGDCRIVEGAVVTFQKTANDMQVKGGGVLPVNVRPCGGK